MSRIFDALSKAQPAREVSRQPVRDTYEEVPRLQSIATERVEAPPESRIIVHTDPRSVGADRFRLLGMRLRSPATGVKRKTLLITSPLPQDGKSTVALNLATVLAEHGKSAVLLLEADFYRPSLTQRLGLQPWPGLAQCLQDDSDPLLALRRIEPLGWYLLPAGEPVNNPAELVQSERFSPLVSAFAAYFDWVVIDSPPVNPVADIVALRARADGCLLVVRAGQTPREAVEEAVRNVGREHVLGIIVNGVDGLNRRCSKYYGKYYGSGSGNNVRRN
jgi:capsular exopolysaccharide synthesis family protein